MGGDEAGGAMSGDDNFGDLLAQQRHYWDHNEVRKMMVHTILGEGQR